MLTKRLRNIGTGACAAWLALPAYGVWELVKEGDDDWELAYLIYEVTLVIGAALAIAFVAALTRGTDRRALRTAGLAVGALGTALALVGAWATVIWMPVLGVAFGLLALAAPGPVRGRIGLLAAGLVAGFVVQMAVAIVSGSIGELASTVGFTLVTAGAVAGVGPLVVARPEVSPARA